MKAYVLWNSSLTRHRNNENRFLVFNSNSNPVICTPVIFTGFFMRFHKNAVKSRNPVNLGWLQVGEEVEVGLDSNMVHMTIDLLS